MAAHFKPDRSELVIELELARLQSSPALTHIIFVCVFLFILKRNFEYTSYWWKFFFILFYFIFIACTFEYIMSRSSNEIL